MSYNILRCPGYRSHGTIQLITSRTDGQMESLLLKQITVPCPECGREMVVE